MTDLEAARETMLEWHLKRRGITDRRVLDAMRAVPREEFVPRALWADAYADHPLPIGGGQTISQPYIVALMMQGALIEPEDRVLDVGTGSGYAAAVAVRLGREVWSIERVATLADEARSRFERLHLLADDDALLGDEDTVATRLHLAIGDGSLGLPAAAPFDVILVAAAAPELPFPLLEQLADGGRLIVPVASSALGQSLIRATRRGKRIEQTSLGSVSFVPLIGRHGWAASNP